MLRSLQDDGVVELLGGPAAHPLLPLLQPDFVPAALESGLADSTWRHGSRPRGIWAPECAWSPGLADAFTAAGVGHFVVDEQTVRDAGGHPHAAWRVAGTELLAVPRDLDVTNLIWSSRSGYPGARPTVTSTPARSSPASGSGPSPSPRSASGTRPPTTRSPQQPRSTPTSSTSSQPSVPGSTRHTR